MFAIVFRPFLHSVCSFCHSFLPTTHSPDSSLDPSSRESNSDRMPRKFRLRTRNVTGVTRASEGRGTRPPMLINIRIVVFDRSISKCQLSRARGQHTISTKAECRPTSRMRLEIKVISIPHDFFRGPHIECESTSPAISVAVKYVN